MLAQTLMTILLGLFLLAPTVDGQCQCPADRGTIVFNHQFPSGPEIIVCGFRSFGNVFNAIEIINCQNNHVLYSCESDESCGEGFYDFFSFKLSNGGIVVGQLVNLPCLKDWEWKLVPFHERTISFKDGSVAISDWREVFSLPPMSPGVQNAFIDAYERDFKTVESSVDPGNIPFRLLVCTLHGIPRAELLLINFGHDHPEHYDGAVSEAHQYCLDFYFKILKK